MMLIVNVHVARNKETVRSGRLHVENLTGISSREDFVVLMPRIVPDSFISGVPSNYSTSLDFAHVDGFAFVVLLSLSDPFSASPLLVSAISIPFSEADSEFPKDTFNILIMSPNLLSCGLWLAILITAVSPDLIPRQSCSAGYTLCSPPGATGSSTYDTSEGLLYLFLNILGTVQPPAPGSSPQPIDPNGPAKRQSATTTMCCKYT